MLDERRPGLWTRIVKGPWLFRSALGYVFKAAPVEASAMFGVLALQGLVPGFTLYALGELIRWLGKSGDQVVQAFPTVPVLLWGIKQPFVCNFTKIFDL